MRRGFVGTNPGRRMGYIEAAGTVGIPPRFLGRFGFAEGAAVVVDEQSQQLGTIDRRGDAVIAPRFRGLSPRSEGVHRCSEPAGVRWLNRSVSLPLPAVRDAADFRDGPVYVRQLGADHVSILTRTGAEAGRSFAPNLLHAAEGLAPFGDETTGRFEFLQADGRVAIARLRVRPPVHPRPRRPERPHRQIRVHRPPGSAGHRAAI